MDDKAIFLKLDSDQQTWHPGDAVTGTVQFTANEQVSVDKVDLIFEGRAKVKVLRRRNNRRIVNRSRIFLFHEEVLLFQGPFTVRPGFMEWPFNFRLPETIAMQSQQEFHCYPQGSENLFERNPVQPLPPSMESASYGMTDIRCYVNYRLTATLHVSGTFHMNREKFRDLPVSPYRELAYPPITYFKPSHPFRIRSLHLDPDVGDRSLSFKERMKSTFSHGDLPVSCFTIEARLPQVAIAGQPMEISLHLRHDVDKSTAPQVPEVFLKEATYSLRERTDVIVKAEHLLTGEDDVYDWDHKDKFREWQGTLPFVINSAEKTMFVEQTVVLPKCPPSFKSFNIARSYTMRVKFAIECAQERETWEVDVPSLEVLPQYSREPMLQQYGPSGMSGGAGDQFLPAYSVTT